MLVFSINVLFWCLCSEVASNIVHMDLVVEFHVTPVLWLDVGVSPSDSCAITKLIGSASSQWFRS